MASSPACSTISDPAYATETEVVILRGRVTELEALVELLQKKIETMESENVELRMVVKGMRDGVWLSQGDRL
jgi:hypothetical protein